MKKISLKNVTLIGIDCVNVERLQKAINISCVGIDFGQVKLLTSLPTDDLRKVEIPHIDSIEKYSEFCIKDLYNYVDTDFVLLVQYDGFVLNPKSWDNDFLNYDYIGASWLIIKDYWFEKFHLPLKYKGKRVVGNGGFSLRSKKFLEISSKLGNAGVFKKYHPEDLMLCVFNRDRLEKEGLKFAPADVATRFSIEGQDDVYEKQFGFHGFKWTNIKKWIDENPQWEIFQEF